MMGRVTRCACFGVLLGSFSRHSGSVSRANGTRLETKSLLARGERMDARPGVRRGRRQLGRLQVPAFHLDRHRSARLAAQREDARHKRQLADGDAIDEILAPAVDGVVDASTYSPSRGTSQRIVGIGLEAVVVVIRHFLAVRVVQHQHGLEPAGHGVGDIGDQLPRLGGDDQPLALARPRTDSG